ncbi:MAG: 3-phosphoshikimate 1-carboxyvinyltransferase [Hyphomonadaceae bacterium]|nr:3-phosphoshikimate 1-carboxyvinyltransferase [Hyphomonadaceae bacterium]
MQLEARPSGPLRGACVPPGDKSISHRALILGALAEGETQIAGLLEGADVLHTAGAMRALGAAPERVGEGAWRILGRGRLAAPDATIDCGNSGTGVRLIIGAAAGYPLAATFTGDDSLRRRPMLRILTPLELMGARFDAAEGGRLPLTLHGGAPNGGPLRAISYTLPVASAQVKSAILLAGLNAEGVTQILEPEPTRDHTERMLKGFGAALQIEGRAIRIAGGQRLHASSVRVPSDPSSAAFAIVAALIVPGSELRAENVLLNPTRTGLFQTLIDMGADLSIENRRDASGEEVGDIVARHSSLRGIVVPPERAPSMIDEYPILAVAAACAEGDTIMRGIAELRVKESDRIALMAKGLTACGASVEEEKDALIVHGTGAPPRGGAQIATGGDHRIAMSHLVLGLAAKEPVRIDEAGMIETSFPAFPAFMRALGADIS